MSHVLHPVGSALAAVFLAVVGVASAQSGAGLGIDPGQTGRIVGRIIDQSSGQGLSDAQIHVVGTRLGASSGVDGRYIIQNVPAGTVTLLVRRIGYGPKEITAIVVEPGKAVEQSVSLAVAAQVLDPVSVTAAVERGSVAEALDMQRTAPMIVNSITSEQISRSVDGDAAQAVQRVSGVTVSDGKYPMVRGVGERYTQSSLNGARLPSPEPERRIVPLDLFPSSLIQLVTVAKTFTPDQPGDFAGAAIDIQTREFPAQHLAAWSTSYGYGTAVSGRTLLLSPSTDRDVFAAGSAGRRTPAPVLAAGRFESQPSQDEVNRMVSSFRNAWQPRARTGTGAGSLGGALGGSDRILGRTVGYLVAGTYSYSQEARAGLRRALAVPGSNGQAEEVDRYVGEFGRTSVQWGGIANFSALVGARTRIAVNNTYNRTADNDARIESGYSQNLQVPLDIARLRYVERRVFASQIAVTHEVSASQRLEYALTRSGVARREPDRSEIVYERVETPSGPVARWLAVSNEGAVRTFGDLEEDAIEASLAYRFMWSHGATPRAVKVGGVTRRVGRDAINRAYSISAFAMSDAQRELAAEEIFDGRFTADGERVFRITPLFAGGSYAAKDELLGVYVMGDLALTPRLTLVGGTRYESSNVEVVSEPTVGALSRTNPRFADLLPAGALTYKLGAYQNLRFAASRTVSRPDYRELSPIQYREVIGFDNVLGNGTLVRALVQNYDLRWEWYPTAEEAFTVSLFAKRFRNPIERVYLGTSGTRVITFQNAKGARNDGVELEARKRLGSVAAKLEPFTVFSNLTLMRSRIRLDAEQASVTSAKRAMAGQAPYVVNAGVTYAARRGITASVLYNTVGDRIQDVGERPLPDVVERSRHVLDLSVRVPLLDSVGLRVDAKNLLDAPYKYTQGPVVREYYRTGRTISLGLNWKR